MKTLERQETLEELEEFKEKLMGLLSPVKNASIYYELSSASQTLHIHIISKDLHENLIVNLHHPDIDGIRWLIIKDYHGECVRTHYEKEVRAKGNEVFENFIQTLKKEFQVKEEKCNIEHEWYIKNGLLRIERI